MNTLKRATLAVAGVLLLAGLTSACEQLASPPSTTTTTTTPASASRPGGKLVPASGTYLGAYTTQGRWEGNDAAFAHMTAREQVLGRRLDIAHHFYGWSNSIPSGLEQWDIANGRIPMMTWQPSVGLDAINNGSQDAYIAMRARSVRDLGAGVFLRWGHEMNGNWYAWDGYHSNDPGTTNGPAKYVQAWRRVHDIFTAQGATNVAWVWEPGASNIPNQPWNHWRNYYPGDEYVDWVGIDGYNWGDLRWPGWTSFEEKFAPVYDDYADRKPIMIAETASTEHGGYKDQWIRDAQAAIKTRFPSIAALVWFDHNKETDWRFDSSQSSLDAFRQLGWDPHFNPVHAGVDAAVTGSPEGPTTTAPPSTTTTTTTTPPPTTTAPTTTTTTAPPSTTTTTTTAPPPTSTTTTTVPAPAAPTIDVRVARYWGATTEPLAGTVLKGKVYVTATVSQPVTQVRFHLDDPTMAGPPSATERYAPFDLLGGQPLDIATLAPGDHTVTVAADLSSGGRATTTVTFTV